MTATSSRRNKFLVVVDNTPESRVALRFACRRALATQGGVVLLRVTHPAEFQHWSGVAERMREEARQEAEELLQGLAAQVNEDVGLMPELVIREGEPKEQVMELVAEDPYIRILVLGQAPESGNPGPLVKSLAIDAAGTLRIPVTIVPGNLTDGQISELA